MNVLVISPLVPAPTTGARNRVYHVLKALSSQHSVSLLILDDSYAQNLSESVSHLETFLRTVKLIDLPAALPKRWSQLLGLLRGKPSVLTSHILPTMQQALDRLFASQRFDVVQYEGVHIANYRLPDDVKVIIDQHNLEFEIRLRTYQRSKGWTRKWYNWLEGHLLKRVEIDRCRKADAILVTSERERKILQHYLPENLIRVVPNGVDCEAFGMQSAGREIANRVIFTGAMDYYPNADAVCFFAQHCWPFIRERLPEATWQIVGKNPLPEVSKLAELPGVLVTGSVPDVRPYLAVASVAIAPLHIGSGTRLKILEAFAMRRAVVSTNIGCEGLSVEVGKHLLIADEPVAFAQAVITLLQQAEQRQALGIAGRALVESTYNWKQCCQPLLLLLEEMESIIYERQKTIHRLV